MFGRDRHQDEPFAGLGGGEAGVTAAPAPRAAGRSRPGAAIVGALGLLLGLGSLVAFDWALFEMVQTGTCASGGPYVSARPCPEGTGLRIAAMTGAIPLGLVGCALLSASRWRNWRAAIGVWLVAWALLFVSAAVVALLAVYSSDDPVVGGAQLGVAIMAAVFVPMGLAPLALLAVGRRRGGADDGLSRSANGRILSVQDTGVTVSNAAGVSLPGTRRVRVSVQVEPDGAAPFTVTTTAVVPDYAAAEVGGSVQVRYHPRDRDQVGAALPGAGAAGGVIALPEVAVAPVAGELAGEIQRRRCPQDVDGAVLLRGADDAGRSQRGGRPRHRSQPRARRSRAPRRWRPARPGRTRRAPRAPSPPSAPRRARAAAGPRAPPRSRRSPRAAPARRARAAAGPRTRAPPPRRPRRRRRAFRPGRAPSRAR